MSIVAQKITYIHPDNQVLFKGIDLTINKGQKVALVGNNGSGKSTFLRILAGTLQAQEGKIIHPTPPYYVPQHFGQYDNLTVAQALRIDGKLEALRAITDGDASLSNFNTLADDWTIEERSLAALHAWGLEHILLSQPMRTLSGGEKTKVFLSGIEIHQPSILLLDEPTNHLDRRSREKLYDFITSCRITLLVVSHDRTLLNLLASIAELSVGGITLYGGNYDFYKEQKEQEQTDASTKNSSEIGKCYTDEDGIQYFYLTEQMGWRFKILDAAAGSRFYGLQQTTDGGNTWEMINEDPFVGNIGVSEGLVFYDENNGIIGLTCAGQDWSNLYRTTDGGKTFTKIEFPGATTGEFYFDMPRKDKDQLVVLARPEAGDTTGVKYVSTDGGATWENAGDF